MLALVLVPIQLPSFVPLLSTARANKHLPAQRTLHKLHGCHNSRCPVFLRTGQQLTPALSAPTELIGRAPHAPGTPRVSSQHDSCQIPPPWSPSLPAASRQTPGAWAPAPIP